MTTLDLDIVHRRTPENVSKLLEALKELDAVYRHDPRRLRPGESHLSGPGHQLLRTIYGDLDCLGVVEGDESYEDLLERDPELDLEAGVALRVIDLPALLRAALKRARYDETAVPASFSRRSASSSWMRRLSFLPIG